jgi:phage terminase large subunit-like protein
MPDRSPKKKGKKRPSSSGSKTNSPRSGSERRPPELETFERFCKELLLPDRSPLEIEDFQRRLLSDYFEGVRETLILIPKKNGKTTLLAALATYHLLTTPDAACYVGASSREQARILYDEAAGLIRRSEWVDAQVKVQAGYLRILNKADSGFIKVLAADANTADGVIPTLALIDELHRHKTGDLYAVFRDGLGPRQGQMVTISTAGDDLDSPLGKTRASARALPGFTKDAAYHYARSDSLAFHEYALDQDDDRDDLDLVKTANPASWQTVDELGKRHSSPTMRSWEWARFACGVWVYGEDTAISDTEWAAVADHDAEIPAGSDGVYLGVDIGLRRDTTALVPVWRASEDDPMIVGYPTILIPPEGGSVSFKEILTTISNYAARWPGLTVVIDPNAGGELVADRIESDLGLDVTIYSQQPRPMALAAQRLTTAIANRAIRHPDHPELNRHVLSAVPKTVGETWRFGKSSKRSVPNDGVIALAMAVSQIAAPAAGPSVYEERELVVL